MKKSIQTTLGMILVTALTILALVACGDASTPATPATPATPTTAARATATAVLEQPTNEPTEDVQDTSDGWITFTSEAGGFSVDMPGEPQETSQTNDSALGKITFHFFQVTDGGMQYAAAYNDYPVEMDQADLDTEQLLKEAIEGAAQGKEVVNTRSIEVQGHPGIEGEINVSAEAHVWYRSILVKSRLYQLIVSAPEADMAEGEANARRFIDSFKLLDQ
ncbi:MAG: hypothetical protein WCD37_06115 [Chloroflexia bacterium]